MTFTKLPIQRAESSRHPAARPGHALQKGQQTKQAIVDAALRLAAEIGLEGLSIGALADVTRMSKSGVFAHFGSREALQISVIREHFERFYADVFEPAMQADRGLPRVRALFANWMKRVSVDIQFGCIFISGAVEFDDRPGPVRDALANSVNIWLAAVDRAVEQAREVGHIKPDTEAHQMAFEIHGLILALHFEARFLGCPGAIERANIGFENIIKHYGKSAASAKPRTPASIPQSKEK